MSKIMVIDHPSFNPELYRVGLAWAMIHATPEGLQFEVACWYEDELKALFDTNDYPITRDQYIAVANQALMEWDI